MGFLGKPKFSLRPRVVGKISNWLAGQIAAPILNWISRASIDLVVNWFIWPDCIPIDLSSILPHDKLPAGFDFHK